MKGRGSEGGVRGGKDRASPVSLPCPRDRTVLLLFSLALQDPPLCVCVCVCVCVRVRARMRVCGTHSSRELPRWEGLQDVRHASLTFQVGGVGHHGNLDGFPCHMVVPHS